MHINFHDIEKKRQTKRTSEQIYKVAEDPNKEKFYVLDMFPYPSGAGLHVGHPKGYIATDTLARKKMLEGFAVLHPMGFDTFGLGTEQYAIDNKMKPQDVAKANIENFKKQLASMGFSYDRNRSFSTADPDYFKRTQWVFLQLYNHYYDEEKKQARPIAELEEKGLSSHEINTQRLAYIDYKPINRCPHCKTGLANEDLEDGKCERCGSEVEQRPMRQRVLRITKYADRLLEGLDNLDWDESMKELERNRIGRSDGTEFSMKIANPGIPENKPENIREWKYEKLSKEHNDWTYEIIWLAMKVHKELWPWLQEKIYHKALKNILEKNGFKVEAEKRVAYRIEGETIGYGAVDLLINGNIAIELKSRKRLEGDFYKQLRTYIQQSSNISIGLLMNFYNGKLEYKRLEKNYLEQPNRQNIKKTDDDILGYSLEHSLEFKVYTTRIDTVFWMTFVVMSPEHPLVDRITTDEYAEAVAKYKEQAKHKTQLERTELQKEKTGQFTGAYAINPFNGKEVPIFIGDYVLANYGTGVVMAVPAHDERDFEFAKKYDIPIITSIIDNITWTPTLTVLQKPEIDTTKFSIREGFDIFGEEKEYYITSKSKTTPLEELLSLNLGWEYTINTEYGNLVDSGEFNGLPSDEAIKAMQQRLADRNIGGEKSNYKIQDWVFSRQRYWGEPFPIVFCQHCHTPLLKGGRSEATGGSNEKHYIDYKPNLKELARDLRNTMTQAEKNLWYHFLSTCPYKFQRQKPIDWYIVDFFCNALKLIIEIDGDSHFTDEAITYDKKRTKVLEGLGFQVIRFTNEEVLTNFEEVCKKITEYRTFPTPPSKGGQYTVVPLPTSALPLTLPDIEHYEPTWREEWPLDDVKWRMETTCPICGKPARRESNTMPGWAGSSRYRLRYMDPKNANALVAKDKENYRGNVDVYVGGAEHVTRHMIYARFWQKFLYDIGVVSQQEPFQRYEKVWLIMAEDGRKMSKRWWNVVNPDDVIAEYGADAFRIYEMFMGPFDQFISRNTNGLKGVKKFIDKVVALWDKVDLNDTNDCRDRACPCPNGEAVNNKTNTSSTSCCRDDGLPRPNGEAVNNATSTSTCKNDGCSRPNPEGVTTPKDIEILLHQTIKKTTEDIDAFRFNTTISQFMILVNKLSELNKIHKDVFQTFIILLAPFAPHLAEEFRHLLGNEFSIFTKAQRPTYDEKKLTSDTINLAIQFNGKVRGTIEITSSASEEEVLALMKTNDKLNTYLESGSIRKIIYVPGKIMNVVIG